VLDGLVENAGRWVTTSPALALAAVRARRAVRTDNRLGHLTRPSRIQVSLQQLPQQLEALGERTLATYTTTTDLGYQLPGFLVSLVMNSDLPSIIKAVRRRAE
jgi:hypothetical protein